MKTNRIILLALLATLACTPSFGQARKGKGKTGTTASAKPSSKIINNFNQFFAGYYFFNYELANSEWDWVFTPADANGAGKIIIYVPDMDKFETEKYKITATGTMYVIVGGKRSKVNFNVQPTGMIIDNMVFQREYQPDKYEGIMSLIED